MVPAASDPSEPPRSTLVRWLRLNLALTTFVLGLFSSAAGMLWQVSQWTSDQAHRLDALTEDVRQGRTLTEGLHTAIVDIDRRLNDITGSRAEARRQIEQEISDLAQRTARQEARFDALSDRAQQQPLPSLLSGHRGTRP